MARPVVPLSTAKNALLFRLHLSLARNESQNPEIDKIALDLKLNSQLIKIAAEELEREGLCTIDRSEDFVEHPEIEGHWDQVKFLYPEITAAGIERVEVWNPARYSEIEALYKKDSYDAWVMGTSSSNDSSDVPASDRTVSRSDNAWNEPDFIGELTPEAEEQVRGLIKQAIEDAPNAGLSNAEQSQVISQLEAADKLANAPVPQWGKVNELLEPLKTVAIIGTSITAILAHLAVLVFL